MSESTHSIRISAPSQATKGEIIELKAVIQHDMESGYRRDEYGKQIPRLILVRFQCLYLGEPVFSAEFFPAVAANPFLNFYTKATESGTLEFVWIDQDGRRYAESVQLEVRHMDVPPFFVHEVHKKCEERSALRLDLGAGADKSEGP